MDTIPNMSDEAAAMADREVRSIEAAEAAETAFRRFLANQPDPSATRHKDVDPSDEDENELFYNGPYLGDSLFHYLNPRNPTRARRRVERLYWESWSRFVMASLLSSFGVLLTLAGLGCCVLGESLSRGFGVIMAGVLMCVPGFYSLFIQWCYVCCRRGYTLDQLPE